MSFILSVFVNCQFITNLLQLKDEPFDKRLLRWTVRRRRGEDDLRSTRTTSLVKIMFRSNERESVERG